TLELARGWIAPDNADLVAGLSNTSGRKQTNRAEKKRFFQHGSHIPEKQICRQAILPMAGT
ncbi:MAG: hypothetical protein OXR03_16480, partial [Rhodospirillaceae bacterium]|nr:hypothetical protein [Rhodospirillaceae bacterium]